MEVSEIIQTPQSEALSSSDTQTRIRSQSRRLHPIFYSLAVMVSISIWFLAFRAPLWLDETGSYWQISGGFSKIWSHQVGITFPAYAYILWLTTVILGKAEMALRVPSVLAMLAAAWVLYKAARELFDRDVAIITTVFFCLHPIVVFAAIDVRPYAFAVLAANATIFALLRLRRSDSNLLAALFGIGAGVILYFHFLFGCILPALAIGFLIAKARDRRILLRQCAVALGAFILASLPVVSKLRYMFATSGTHVFDVAPPLAELGRTVAPGWGLFVFGGAVLVAVAVGAIDLRNMIDPFSILVCASLALIPLGLLYGASVATPIHIFTSRYRLVAIPGIALCWGLLVSQLQSRTVRLLFCVALVSVTAYQNFMSPDSGKHGYTWKYALEFAEKNAAADHAPMLICSDFPEADYETMPVGHANESNIFTPLSYYKVSMPVVPLPRALNREAIRVASNFLQDPSRRQQRFLALAFWPSYRTLDWLASSASATHSVRVLGKFDGIEVREFLPRPQENTSR